jgi:hypothetical protein
MCFSYMFLQCVSTSISPLPLALHLFH